jgi:hypothetical protein
VSANGGISLPLLILHDGKVLQFPFVKVAVVIDIADFLLAIAADLAERGGIDEIDVPFDQFGKCYFRPGPRVLTKQFIVRLHIYL